MSCIRFLVARLSPALFALVVLSGCNDENVSIKKSLGKVVRRDSISTIKPDTVASFHYHFISLHNKNKAIRDSAGAMLKALTPGERNIILRLNRVDAATYKRLDTIVIPDRIDTNWMAYCIFPTELPILKDVRKMLFFAYYQEAFAAYENGKLVRYGPTNMGKKASPTPTGLFSCNWKAVETVSTVNDEWILKWNFNVWNKGGVGFHQYQLPGYPASHSCIRLLEDDAKFLFTWADQWIVKNGLLAAQGTPVLIFGHYPFGHHKPWWGLVENPNALNISADSMTAVVQPHLEKILARQKQRDELLAQMPAKSKDTAAIAKH